MANSPPPTPSQVEKTLKQAVNQVLASKGIRPSTRSGNKELSMLLKRAAQAPFTNTAEIETVGQNLGSKIAELSEQKGKKSLDAGVIRSIAFDQGWPAAIGLPQMNPTLAATADAAQMAAAPKLETPANPSADAEDSDTDPAPVEDAAEDVVETAASEVAVGTTTDTAMANPALSAATALDSVEDDGSDALGMAAPAAGEEE